MPASREVQALMEEMGFLPRTIRRGADALLYFKQSEHIEDFLTKIGAPAAAMDIMTAKVGQDMQTALIALANRDMANVNKTLDAAQEQMSAIERLRGSARWDRLPEKLVAADGGAAAGIPGAVADAAGGEVRSAGDEILHESSNEKADGGGQGAMTTRDGESAIRYRKKRRQLRPVCWRRLRT